MFALVSILFVNACSHPEPKKIYTLRPKPLTLGAAAKKFFEKFSHFKTGIGDFIDRTKKTAQKRIWTVTGTFLFHVFYFL